MPWIVDEIEEGLATLENTEDQEIIYIPLTKLPAGTKESSALIKTGDSFEPDTSEETAARSANIRAKFERLKRKTK